MTGQCFWTKPCSLIVFRTYSKTSFFRTVKTRTPSDYSNCILSPGQIPIPLHEVELLIIQTPIIRNRDSNSISGPLVSCRAYSLHPIIRTIVATKLANFKHFFYTFAF